MNEQTQQEIEEMEVEEMEAVSRYIDAVLEKIQATDDPLAKLHLLIIMASVVAAFGDTRILMHDPADWTDQQKAELTTSIYQNSGFGSAVISKNFPQLREALFNILQNNQSMSGESVDCLQAMLEKQKIKEDAK